MFCSNCGQRVHEGSHFCEHCGAQFQEGNEIAPYEQVGSASGAPVPTNARRRSAKDPYKEQIAELKLHLKQLKLELRQISTGMASTRSQYNQTSAFIPEGILHKGYKLLEDARLLGPQQQKQRLQQEILRLEQELLEMQQAQLNWKEQQA